MEKIQRERRIDVNPDDFEGTIDEIIARLQVLKERIPSDARIEFDAESRDYPYHNAEITVDAVYYEEETDDEYHQRIHQEEARKRARREEYERLKREFEGK